MLSTFGAPRLLGQTAGPDQKRCEKKKPPKTAPRLQHPCAGHELAFRAHFSSSTRWITTSGRAEVRVATPSALEGKCAGHTEICTGHPMGNQDQDFSLPQGTLINFRTLARRPQWLQRPFHSTSKVFGVQEPRGGDRRSLLRGLSTRGLGPALSTDPLLVGSEEAAVVAEAWSRTAVWLRPRTRMTRSRRATR
jgi:hypothetical protein